MYIGFFGWIFWLDIYPLYVRLLILSHVMIVAPSLSMSTDLQIRVTMMKYGVEFTGNVLVFWREDHISL